MPYSDQQHIKGITCFYVLYLRPNIGVYKTSQLLMDDNMWSAHYTKK